LLPASLFDVAMVAYQVDFSALKHPLCIYIPKSESADEALWWRDLFQMIARLKGLPTNAIRCMALVESHPLAFQMEEFAGIFATTSWTEPRALGLHGQLDPLQSGKPEWVLPDRNTIPHKRGVLPKLAQSHADICHKHGCSRLGNDCFVPQPRRRRAERTGAEILCGRNKKNEANSLMDGA